MTIHNPEIARLFDRYAVLLEIQGANPFRIRAYRNAARTIENLPRDLSVMLGEGAYLTELPGIGEDLAHKLTDIVETEQFAELEKLKHHLPVALADLTEVPGIGPKRVKTLFRVAKIKSLKDLAGAARKGRLQKLPGFGPKMPISKPSRAQARSKWQAATADARKRSATSTFSSPARKARQ
jgi:DNA polymerase (family 10)